MASELLTFFIGAFTSLFTIMNPLSTASLYMTITRGESNRFRRIMVRKASITAFIVLLVFALGGTYILNFFGITIHAFRIAGGLIIVTVGYHMLHSRREHLPTDEDKKEASEKEDISIIPLAIPMLSGPGAMTTVIVLGGNIETPIYFASLILAILCACLAAYIILANSKLIDSHLGSTGKLVVDRIMGLIVLVIGIQYVINGVDGVVMLWATYF